VAGNYTVTTTDANGCSATSAATATTVVVPSTGSRTYPYSGAVDTFTVPECVTAVQIDAGGAQGGSNNYTTYPGIGGYGGRIVARVTVAPASVLQIRVGGQGTLCTVGNAGGYNGGGSSNCTGYTYNTSVLYSGTGGGATDVRLSPYGLNDRVVVAGGGGGAGFNCFNSIDGGGPGGGTTGGRFESTCGGTDMPGSGGTQAAGGAGGFIGTSTIAEAGYLGTGGSGFPVVGTSQEGGGGGGGYYGGGGGAWHGGGGGSDFYLPSICMLISDAQGTNPGNGSLTLSY
jgi:hypothetical protein